MRKGRADDARIERLYAERCSGMVCGRGFLLLLLNGSVSWASDDNA